MPIYATQGEAKEYAKAPEGNHQAICIGIFDIGTHDAKDPTQKPKRKVILQWELCQELMEDDRPFSVSREFTLSTHEKGFLRPVLNSWRGKPLTEAEALRFDISCLLGKACMVQVVHEKSKTPGKVYVNVAAVASMPKGMSVPKPANPLRLYSLDDGDDYPEGMPAWMIRKVEECNERRDRAVSRGGTANYDRPRSPTNLNVQGATTVPSDDDDDDMSDVPF